MRNQLGAGRNVRIGLVVNAWALRGRALGALADALRACARRRLTRRGPHELEVRREAPALALNILSWTCHRIRTRLRPCSCCARNRSPDIAPEPWRCSDGSCEAPLNRASSPAARSPARSSARALRLLALLAFLVKGLLVLVKPSRGSPSSCPPPKPGRLPSAPAAITQEKKNP